jgi:diadenosine tetraphosphate (Ap4A) HIT family hydrolase
VLLADSVVEEVSDCRYCSSLSADADRLDWAVVAEDELFVAIPSLGSLLPGWLLVVPKHHTLNLASLPPSERIALDAFVARLIPEWAAEFGRLSAFEHGPVLPGSAAGCSIDHAHLHLVPVQALTLLDGARQRYPWLAWMRVSDLPSTPADPYLFVDDLEGRRWLAADQRIPSQSLRRVIAHQLGRAERYDWKRHPEYEVVRETLRRTRPAA